jgi:phosphonate transport system permease protein
LSCIAHGLLESMPDRRRSPPAAGVLLSLPLALMAARNLAPAGLGRLACARVHRRCAAPSTRSSRPSSSSRLWASVRSPACCALVRLQRWASWAKLLAEVLEETRRRAGGGGAGHGCGLPATVLAMGVLPQVIRALRRLLAAYQLDSNLRNSTMVGHRGGGGIGAALFTGLSALRLPTWC